MGKAFNLDDAPFNSYNTLWLTFLHVDQKYIEFIEEISEKLLQNLYVLQPQLDAVLFLKRGEVEALDDIEDAYKIVRRHFF